MTSQTRRHDGGRADEHLLALLDARPDAPAGQTPRRRLHLDDLAAMLAPAHQDDATRHPAHEPLRWQVLTSRVDGVSGLLDLAPRPRTARWLRRERPAMQLVPQPSHPDCDAALTLPAGLDDYAAVVLVEHDPGELEPDPRRLLAAGNAAWRRAVTAGFDAVLITAQPRGVPGRPHPGDPVVAVGVALAAVAAVPDPTPPPAPTATGRAIRTAGR